MTDTRNQTTLAMLQKAVVTSGSIASVAVALGYSRPSLSRYLNEADHPAPGKIEKKIVAYFTRRDCPYLGAQVSQVYCTETNTGPTPTWDPSALAQRRMCQSCPHNTQEKKS